MKVGWMGVREITGGAPVPRGGIMGKYGIMWLQVGWWLLMYRLHHRYARRRATL